MTANTISKSNELSPGIKRLQARAEAHKAAKAVEAEPVRFTFRKNGKAHRGLTLSCGYTVCSCSCPGSQNGRLIQGAFRVAEGWEAANCGN